MKLNIALAQINTEPGNIQANLEKHLTLAKQACQVGMDLWSSRNSR
jgi:predicted amidohydrolase